MRSWLPPAILISLLLGACTHVLPVNQSVRWLVEQRQPLDRKRPEHNLNHEDFSTLDAVGIVLANPGQNSGRYGTAWLAVDACHVITAEHVIYGPVFDETAPLGVPVTFYVGQTDHPTAETYSFSRAYSGTVVAHGNAAQTATMIDTKGRDWAVIRLDENVVWLRALPIVGRDSWSYLGSTVMAAGYPVLLLPKEGITGAGRQLWADEGPLVGGHAATDDSDFAVYSVQLQLGTGESGGPVIVTEAGQRAAGGIVQAVDTSSALAGKGDFAGMDISKGHANQLVMFGEGAVTELRNIIRSTPCAPTSLELDMPHA
jgi:hypothetical protein